MARGWESKSVEEQQSEFKQRGDGSGPKASPEESRKATQLQALHLQRAQVQQRLQQSQNSRYIELLQRELDYLDRELRNLRG